MIKNLLNMAVAAYYCLILLGIPKKTIYCVNYVVYCKKSTSTVQTSAHNIMNYIPFLSRSLTGQKISVNFILHMVYY